VADYSGGGTAAAAADDDDDKYSLGKAVGIVGCAMVWRTWGCGFDARHGHIFAFSPRRSDWLWIPHSLLSHGHCSSTTEA
jgi:hypothetical protein